MVEIEKNVMSDKEWESVSKKTYWDRNIPLSRWREKISIGHKSYLPDAVSTMNPVEFISFYGLSSFKQDWPRLRLSLPKNFLKYTGLFDLAWSQVIGGGWNLCPTEDFFSMPKKRREFLIQVALRPGMSIYAIAKTMGIQYRRAHDHAMRLVSDGKIKAIESVEQGRCKSKLFPAYPVRISD